MKWTPEKLDALSDDAYKNITGVIAKNTSRWWESDDPTVVALNQLAEPILMVDFSFFHECVERLLDRPVWTHEFGLNHDGLVSEALAAVRRTSNGEKAEINQIERDSKIIESFQQLSRFCKENDKTLIPVVVGQREVNNDDGI